MESRERQRLRPGSERIDASAGPVDDGAGLDGIAEPRADDEASAARARFRGVRMPALPADERIAPALLPGEEVLAVHRSALLERRQPAPGARVTTGIAGALYVTSRRLVLVGRLTLSFGLDAIDEVLLSGERLLLILRDGQGLMVEVPQPRLLRVELSAARAGALAGRAPARTHPAAR